MTAITVKNAYKFFGRRSTEAIEQLRGGADAADVKSLGTAAVIDASFTVEPGEIFVVMGLSGSGKSTLIRMLNGLLPPTAGEIYVGDEEIGSVDPAELRRIRQSRISMVFQHFALLPHRTVLDNAAYALRIQGVGKAEREERARSALEMVDMVGWDNHVPAQLSGGMRQRVGLARALAADTDILLMDEAFSALDPLIRREMQDQLIELQQSLGKTIVFITHDLNEAMRLGDRIAVMRSGRIVQIDTGEQILAHPANDYVAKFIADVDPRTVFQARSLMAKPSVTVTVGQGPRQTLREIRDEQVPAAFVVDRDRRYVGTVTDTAAFNAQQAGATTLHDAVEAAPSVHEDTLLAELLNVAASDSHVPVPVVNDSGRLVGVIPRVSIWEAMTPYDEEANV
ncbi:glycine betaine/L-proline ABC transporter ATP-binding protein [Pseudactinotalea sp. HY158]|uniref:quaternary amine ABC transporter ATP-binding protein n=1 Tax=Pseudactinotalea sp. HY158 TaxID=2654547 RepID=UPI00129C12E4|nr:glycine betaine/L-proline ABC transporter ATP-binding protein [Pseudactinotalea sp. HY158]QGH68844.1 betaine/proline/choline family ABC transporter ATP-binding protein [Pseudactinotalea sp. HY158]